MPAPPFAIGPLAFSFPALAAAAGRAPLGGAREVVLACFMAARLSAAVLPPVALSEAGRAARAASARAWLASLSLPAAMRIPLARLVDATGGDDRAALAAALDGVTAVTAPHLDPAARSELADLSAALLAIG